jgi:hypothetical protein
MMGEHQEEGRTFKVSEYEELLSERNPLPNGQIEKRNLKK